jgi:hypothetical protein
MIKRDICYTFFMSEIGDSRFVESARAAEFDSAYEKLKKFVELPTDSVINQKGLEMHVRGLGSALRTVIESRGTFDKHDHIHPSGGQFLNHMIHKEIGESVGNKDTFRAYTDGEAILFDRKKQDGFETHVYEIELPIGGEFSDIDPPCEAAEMTAKGTTKPYVPSHHPSKPEIQQGYTRILRTAVQDLLSVIDEPVGIPEEILEQFKEER